MAHEPGWVVVGGGCVRILLHELGFPSQDLPHSPNAHKGVLESLGAKLCAGACVLRGGSGRPEHREAGSGGKRQSHRSKG